MYVPLKALPTYLFTLNFPKLQKVPSYNTANEMLVILLVGAALLTLLLTGQTNELFTKFHWYAY